MFEELCLDNSLGFNSPPGVAFGLAGAEVEALPASTVETQFFVDAALYMIISW